MDHVGKRHQQRAADHQIRNDPQERDRYGNEENKRRQRDPLDAAQIRSDLGLRRRVNGLKQPLAEHAVVDHGLVDEPGEARRAVDLTLPFRRPGRPEKHEVLEPQ